MKIAQRILEQLGGRRFVAMIGARYLVPGDDYLQFEIDADAAINGANVVRITLDLGDTYRVSFYRVAGDQVALCGEPLQGVYADQLAGAFIDSTGYDVHH